MITEESLNGESKMKNFNCCPAFLCIQFLILCFINVNAQNSVDHQITSDTASNKQRTNIISKFDSAPLTKTGVGGEFKYFADSIVQGKLIKISIVGPHSFTHPPHSHPVGELFLILEGNAEVLKDGQWVPVEPMTCYYCPPYVRHGIRNPGDKVIKYLVVKDGDKR